MTTVLLQKGQRLGGTGEMADKTSLIIMIQYPNTYSNHY